MPHNTISTTEGLGLAGILAAAIGSVIFACSKALRKIVAQFGGLVTDKITRKRFVQQMKDEEFAIQYWKSEFKQMPFVHRWAYLKGKNSGGVPVTGRKYSVECIDGGQKDKDKESPRDRYNFTLIIDPEYSAMITKLIESGHVSLNTAQLNEGNFLKDFYLSEGVKSSLMFYIKNRGEESLFFSVANYESEFTRDQIVKILSVLSTIKKYLIQTP